MNHESEKSLYSLSCAAIDTTLRSGERDVVEIQGGELG